MQVHDFIIKLTTMMAVQNAPPASFIDAKFVVATKDAMLRTRKQIMTKCDVWCVCVPRNRTLANDAGHEQ